MGIIAAVARALLPYLGYALAAAALFTLGYSIGDASRHRKVLEAQLEAQARAAERERSLNSALKTIQESKDADLLAMRDAYEHVARELQSRPVRMLPAQRAACQGASGSELSRSDAEFLAREAARADYYARELIACQDREWETYRKLTQ